MVWKPILMVRIHRAPPSQIEIIDVFGDFPHYPHRVPHPATRFAADEGLAQSPAACEPTPNGEEAKNREFSNEMLFDRSMAQFGVSPAKGVRLVGVSLSNFRSPEVNSEEQLPLTIDTHRNR